MSWGLRFDDEWKAMYLTLGGNLAKDRNQQNLDKVVGVEALSSEELTVSRIYYI